MCGIVGIFPFEKLTAAKEEIRKEAMLFLFTELLQLTEERGKDATGVTAFFNNGDYMIQKAGIEALKFISKFGGTSKDYEGFIKLCRKNKNPLSALIGHCRKSSVGNTTDNDNNHPIKAGEIVGVHNGTLKNHNIIFKKLNCKRDGEVDSEAIFRLLEYYTKNCKTPFTLEILEEVVKRLDGTYSCLCYNANNPYQIAAFRDNRPLEFILIRPLKILIAVSERKFADKALFNYNKAACLYEKKFTPIKSEHLAYAALLNDSVSIIDLTQTIDKKTTIFDIVNKKDTLNIKKMWAFYKAPKNRYQYDNKKYVSHNTKNYTTTSNSTNTNNGNKKNKKSKKDSDKFNGKIYCKELKAYVSEDEVKEAAKVGGIYIDHAKGDITNLDTITKKEPTKTQTKEVDISATTKLQEAAANSLESRKKCETDKGLVTDINAHSEEAIRLLSPFVLANKMRKHLYEQAFIEGAEFYKNQLTKDKLDSAQKIIKIAKKIIKILALGTDSNRLPKDIKVVIKNILNAYDLELPTLKELESLLTVGDTKNNISVKTLFEIAEERKDGNENNSSQVTADGSK